MNKAKRIIFSIVAVIMLLTYIVPSFALPINTDMSDSYNYSYWGESVAAPLAYKAVSLLGYKEIGANIRFQPVDLFCKNGLTYVLDIGDNAVYVLDERYRTIATIKTLKGDETTLPPLNKRIIDPETKQLKTDPELEKAVETTFNRPEGIFVDDDGFIHVADTQNRRIVVCDIEGNVKNVIQSVKVSVLGDSYIFKPLKIVQDKTGGYEIVAYAVNRGLMEIDSDGKFRSFIGAPPIQINPIDWFWRQISTAEQKKRLIKNVPTEYNNITIDERGFIYSTIGTLGDDILSYGSSSNAEDLSGKVTPIKKLNSNGKDVLRRLGYFAPICDLYLVDGVPQVKDVAVDNESGRYTMLDFTMGRFFTYDSEGNLLYVGGGAGNQYGRFKSPNAIALNGTDILVSDGGNNTITVFEATEYVKLINEASYAGTHGMYDEAEELWRNVIQYNSNMYIAYIGLGKAELRRGMQKFDDSRLENYENALKYFETADEKVNYSKAYQELLKDSMTKNFNWIMLGLGILIAGVVALYVRFKLRQKKGRSVSK